MALLFVCLVLCLTQAAEAQEPLPVGDLMAMRSVSDVAMSPDGSRVAYVVGAAGVASIWIAPAGGGPNRKLAEGGAPAWSPDGARLAFLRARSGKTQIWTISLEGGEAVPLTAHETAVEKFEWSPDGRRIAFLATEAGNRAAGVPTVIDVTDRQMKRLWTVNVENRQAKLLTPGDYSAGGYDQWFPDGFSWSPDSREVVFSRRPYAKAGGHLYGDVVSVGTDGGEPRYLVRREGMDGNPRWSPAGGQVGFLATGVYDWVKISNLWVVSPKTGQLRNLTADFDESVKEFHWTGDGKRIYFIVGQGVSTQVVRLDVAAARVEKLTSGQGVYGHLSLSRDGRRCAFTWEDGTSPAEVHVSALDEWKPARVSAVHAGIASWNLPVTEIVRWKSFDGMEIEGIVHKPAGVEAAKRYPLLVIPHGGPHGVMTNGFPSREVLAFTSRGWVVFRPNFRGSGAHGERFLRANLNGWGVGDYQDVMTGVDHLIAAGLADGERMAIAGSSYGGYMTSWTISQTDRFKAAVAGAAVTDIPSFMRTTDVPERFEDYLGKDPNLYPRHSPMHFGERMRTPTLIWHGDEDLRVPLMQGRHLYTQLRKNGVPVEFVVYHGEPHGLRRAAHQKDLLEREIRWLEKWVLGK